MVALETVNYKVFHLETERKWILRGINRGIGDFTKKFGDETFSQSYFRIQVKAPMQSIIVDLGICTSKVTYSNPGNFDYLMLVIT